MNLVFFFIGRCSASSVIFPEQIEKYTSTNTLAVILFLVGIFFSLLSQWFYLCITRQQLLQSYEWFHWCRKIFICIVISCICVQLVNSLSCRSIDFLYNYRYMLILISQGIGIVLTLCFAFFLGVKCAAIKEINWSPINNPRQSLRVNETNKKLSYVTLYLSNSKSLFLQTKQQAHKKIFCFLFVYFLVRCCCIIGVFSISTISGSLSRSDCWFESIVDAFDLFSIFSIQSEWFRRFVYLFFMKDIYLCRMLTIIIWQST